MKGDTTHPMKSLDMFAGLDCCNDRIEVTWCCEWYCSGTRKCCWIRKEQR
jgi:hypothetical protein